MSSQNSQQSQEEQPWYITALQVFERVLTGNTRTGEVEQKSVKNDGGTFIYDGDLCHVRFDVRASTSDESRVHVNGGSVELPEPPEQPEDPAASQLTGS